MILMSSKNTNTYNKAYSEILKRFWLNLVVCGFIHLLDDYSFRLSIIELEKHQFLQTDKASHIFVNIYLMSY